MKKSILIAILLLVVGALIILSVFLAIGFDFTRLNAEKFERVEYKVVDPVDTLEIYLSSFDVRIIPAAEGEALTLLLPKGKEQKCTATLVNGELFVRELDGREWYEKTALWDVYESEETTVEIRLPVAAYERLLADISSGDLSVEGVCFNSLFLETDTGDISVQSEKVMGEIKVTTGDVLVKGAKSGNLNVETTTGDVEIADCTLQDMAVKVGSGDIAVARTSTGGLHVKATTGDVSLEDVCAASCDMETTTGDVSMLRVALPVPPLAEGQTGGVIRATTTTGDVEAEAILAIRIEWKTNSGSVTATRANVCSADIETTSGDVAVDLVTANEFIFSAASTSGDVHIPESKTGGDFRVKTTSGDIIVTKQAPSA